MKLIEYQKIHAKRLAKKDRRVILAYHPEKVDADGDRLHDSFSILGWKHIKKFGWVEVKDLPKDLLTSTPKKRGRKPKINVDSEE